MLDKPFPALNLEETKKLRSISPLPLVADENSITSNDLNALREAVRRVHFKYFPEKHGSSFVTNAMVDQIIDWYGPEVVEKSMKVLVDKGLR